MNFSFTKMHGLGNDFVIINALTQVISLTKEEIKTLADRHCGIGFDQLLVIRKSLNADFYCDIFNADGSKAEQCGNGMRCLARFLHQEKLILKKKFTIETKAGVVEILINQINNITVNMGTPQIEPACDIQWESKLLTLANLKIGNPHAILQVHSLTDFPLHSLGKLIATHELYPEGTNVGFMKIVDSNRIQLQTFERGVGPTFACGSNACAAAVVGILQHHLTNKVEVELPLGHLFVEWNGNNSPVFLTGPAEHVFTGRL